MHPLASLFTYTFRKGPVGTTIPYTCHRTIGKLQNLRTRINFWIRADEIDFYCLLPELRSLSRLVKVFEFLQ